MGHFVPVTTEAVRLPVRQFFVEDWDLVKSPLVMTEDDRALLEWAVKMMRGP